MLGWLVGWLVYLYTDPAGLGPLCRVTTTYITICMA